MSKTAIDLQLNEQFFSQAFLAQSHQMGLHSVEDILNKQPAELIRLEGFSYHWLSELSRVFSGHGLSHLLQSIRENNGD